MVSEFQGRWTKYYIYAGAAFFSFFVILPLYVLIIIALGVPNQTVAAYFPALLPTKLGEIDVIPAKRIRVTMGVFFQESARIRTNSEVM